MWPKLPFSQQGRTVGLPSRVHVDDPVAREILALSLAGHLEVKGLSPSDPVVVVCIGTDRSTGDALGPLVGTHLEHKAPANTFVFGTLEHPVHATNLEEVLIGLEKQHPEAFILALDACLGKSESVGYISLKDGALKPGTGVNKKLPPVGDLHLIGVVNVGGFMDYFVLQNTRLGLVYRMAQVMTEAICMALSTLRGSSSGFDSVREIATT